MELSQTIKDLCEEKKHLDKVIAALEAIDRADSAETATGAPSRGLRRRGRKSMGGEERQQVAERMRAYWAGRRNPQGNGTEAQEATSHAASTSDSGKGHSPNGGEEIKSGAGEQ